MSNVPSSPYDYQVEGGALLLDAPTYVRRQADDQLYDALKQGRFCYVLNARQMGKSSLKVRTMQRLHNAGIACAAVDLQGIGTSVTEEQWYVGIISRIARPLQLHRTVNVNGWWVEHGVLSCVQRFTTFIETVLLPSISSPIVIFIDEIDLARNLPFSSDDFFAALRECHDRRADSPDYRRLAFALLGVSTPSDLIHNKQITPFNIGQSVDLTGFQLEESHPLLPGLASKSDHPQALLNAVLGWTGGQPFLTQKVCRLILTANSVPPGEETQWVEHLVQSKIIDNWEAQDTPQHLKTIRDRLYGGNRTGRLLGLYQQILQQQEIPADDSPEQMDLRLTGLVVKQNNTLKVYNRIYAAVFNQTWLDHALSDLRPYAESLNAWVTSEFHDESRLLRGNSLNNAQVWAEGKSLSDLDYKFLAASQELDRRNVTLALAAEQRAKELLENAQRQAKKWIWIGAIVLAISVIGATVSTIIANSARTEAKTAAQDLKETQQALSATQADLNELEKERNSLQGEKQRLINNVQASRTSADEARSARQEAEATARRANQELAVTRTELGQLNARVQQTTQTLSRANQSLARTVSEKSALEKQIQQIQAVLNQTHESIQIEQQVVTALRLLRVGDEISAILSAMQSGQHLQGLIGERNSFSQYPTISPLFALQTILNSVHLQNMFDGHQDDLHEVSLSPNGQWVATAGEDGTAKVWDLSGHLVEQLSEHQGAVRSVSFSSDGQWLATAGVDGRARLWNMNLDGQVGNPPILLQGHEGWVNRVRFVPGQERLVTVGRDGNVQLWDMTGHPIRRWQAYESSIEDVSIAPNAEYLATAGEDGIVRLWTFNGQLIREWYANDGSRIRSMAISPTGNQRLITGGDDGVISVWDASSGNLITAWQGHQGMVRSISIRSDGQQIATAGSDGRGRVWSDSGRQVAELGGHFGLVNSIRFSPSRNRHEQQLVSVDEEGIVRLWNLTRQDITEFQGITSEASNIAFSPTGQHIVTLSDDQIIRIWNRSRQSLLASIPNQAAFSISPDGQHIVTTGLDKTARFWTMSGQPVAEPIESGVGWLGVDNTNSGIRLIGRAPDGSITIDDAQNGRVADLPTSLDVKRIELSPDGQYIALIGEADEIELWTVSGQRLAAWISEQETIHTVGFSPNRRYLATAGNDGTIKIWDFTGLLLHGWEGHQRAIYSVSFSSDGERLASAGDDGTVKVWLASSGLQLAQLDIFQNFDRTWIRGVSFSSDGKDLAIAINFRHRAATPQSTIWVWRHQNLDELLTSSCNWLRYYLTNHSNTRSICP